LAFSGSAEFGKDVVQKYVLEIIIVDLSATVGWTFPTMAEVPSCSA
jgi:hypothetical protein